MPKNCFTERARVSGAVLRGWALAVRAPPNLTIFRRFGKRGKCSKQLAATPFSAAGIFFAKFGEWYQGFRKPCVSRFSKALASPGRFLVGFGAARFYRSRKRRWASCGFAIILLDWQACFARGFPARDKEGSIGGLSFCDTRQPPPAHRPGHTSRAGCKRPNTIRNDTHKYPPAKPCSDDKVARPPGEDPYRVAPSRPPTLPDTCIRAGLPAVMDG